MPDKVKELPKHCRGTSCGFCELIEKINELIGVVNKMMEV